MTLEFDGIEYGYDDRRLLTGIHMTCQTGRITALLGRNGTGKSTLMKIAFGAIRPEVVSIRIDGRALTPPPFSKGFVCYLPQETFVPGNLSLLRILGLYQVDPNKILGCFPELEQDLDKYHTQVSGGRLRLFEVLLILFLDTPFCFLDEPFTGLSPLMVERLQEIIVAEKKDKGILISDHMFRQVMAISDTIYLLSNGTTFLIKEEEELARRGYLV